MRAEDSGGAGCRYGLYQSAPDTLRFATARNRNNQLPHVEDGRDGECEGLQGNVFESRKPTLRDLLLPALCVERDHLHCIRVVEVRLGGIVECYMSILPNPQQT